MTAGVATPTVEVRPLAITELPLCLPFGEAFFREFALRGTFNPVHFVSIWKGLIETVGATILGLFRDEQLVGGLGALVSPDIFTGDRVATELFWFIGPEHRSGTGALKLLRAFEAWGHAHGATDLRLSHFMMKNNEQLQRLYEHRGYVLLEQGYQKRLGGPSLCQ